ncbi:L-rhamnose mutarotase [Sphingomonas sp. FW199]|uniref:L-rhamnose mutarotase n=1 Tax=Sphingomonas sp. FW199 TaxID=3400217 RepID=UPI003CEA40BE
MTARRFVNILDLADDPDLIAAYVGWHRPGGPPAAVTAAIRRSGILQMEIFLSGNRLVMIIDAGPDFDPAARSAADAGNPDVLAWERLMDGFQRPVPWAADGEKWVAAHSIFRLTDQPDGKQGVD